MKYKITIEKTYEEKKVVGGNWEIIGTEEVKRDQHFLQKGDSPTRIEDKRGYTPEITKTETVTKEVYSQQVDELDLASVIKAVNSIE